MRGGIFCHVGQAEVVNVAGVCSPSTNQVRHHENATTEDIPQVPGLNHSSVSPMKKSLRPGHSGCKIIAKLMCQSVRSFKVGKCSAAQDKS